MHIAGIYGMPRRVYTYPSGMGLELPNLLSSIGSFAVALIGGSITGVVTLVLHRRHHRRARDAYRPESIDQAAIVLPMAGR